MVFSSVFFPCVLCCWRHTRLFSHVGSWFWWLWYCLMLVPMVVIKVQKIQVDERTLLRILVGVKTYYSANMYSDNSYFLCFLRVNTLLHHPQEELACTSTEVINGWYRLCFLHLFLLLVESVRLTKEEYRVSHIILHQVSSVVSPPCQFSFCRRLPKVNLPDHTTHQSWHTCLPETQRGLDFEMFLTKKPCLNRKLLIIGARKDCWHFQIYSSFSILLYHLFKGYRPCRRPLMRKQSRGGLRHG